MQLQLPASTALPPESEWLGTVITDLIGGLCGNIHECSTPFSLLTTLLPESVDQTLQPVPPRWKTEQILEDAVVDFSPTALEEGFSTVQGLASGKTDEFSNLTQIKPEVTLGTDKDSRIQPAEASQVLPVVHSIEEKTYVHTHDPYATHSIPNLIVSGNKLNDNKRMNEALSMESSCGSIRKQLSHDDHILEKTMHHHHSLTLSIPSISPHLPVSRDSFETLPTLDSSVQKKNNSRHFGTQWFIEAMTRLELPILFHLQMERIQELTRCSDLKIAIKRLEAEKVRIKHELKQYDFLFSQSYGGMPDREHKEPLRPLYTYYRRVKIALQRANKQDQSKQIHQSEVIVRTGDQSIPLETFQTQLSSMVVNEPYATEDDQKNSLIHRYSEEELHDKQRLRKLQDDKLLIRNKLQKFQDEFLKLYGRPIRYHRDIVPIENEYKQYKQLKEHINKVTETIRRRRHLQQLTHSCG